MSATMSRRRIKEGNIRRSEEAKAKLSDEPLAQEEVITEEVEPQKLANSKFKPRK